MLVDSAHYAPYYEAVRKDTPFTHMAQASLPSLGVFYDGLRVPDLLLTVH